MLIGGAVQAEENPTEDQSYVSPDSEVYHMSRFMEQAEYELTEDKTIKALLQDGFAEERLAEIKELIEMDSQEEVDELFKEYEQHLEEIKKNLEAAKAEGEDVTEVEETVEKIKNSKQLVLKNL